jgi:hypothetical protein
MCARAAVECLDCAVAEPVRFTRHCIEQYQLRFRPALDLRGAEAELASIAGCGRMTTAPPGWLADRRRDADAYFVIGEDLVMPLVRSTPTAPWVAVTCLSRGTLSSMERDRRRRRRTRPFRRC